MRKFPGMVGGLKAKQLMLSSGGEVTSISCSISLKRQQLLQKNQFNVNTLTLQVQDINITAINV